MDIWGHNMETANKIIIITGASQGIGLAAARLLSARGGKVVLAARSADVIDALQKELPNSLAVTTDMRKPRDIVNLVNKTIERFGRIDILINNAGQGMSGPVENIDIEEYKSLMELNVYGVLRAMQAVIGPMRAQGGGMILNVSSGVTKRYIPDIAAYSSTKYALNALSLIARQELAKDNIVVSVVHPRMTASNFFQNMVGGPPDFGSRELPPMDSSEKVAAKIAELIESGEAELEINT
ncbi:MAG: SDR family NAD(P)-dependent oxidoreductase [Nitrospirota bacterium]